MAKQTVTFSAGNGSWRAIVDGDNIGSQNFSGQWSGAVEQKVEFRRLDVPASTDAATDAEGGPQ